MGGSIWVESDGIPGHGSRFSFTLPAIKQAPCALMVAIKEQPIIIRASD
jgi:chemotaxis protein histidine kinase CheA